jgi:hypothetical protein
VPFAVSLHNDSSRPFVVDGVEVSCDCTLIDKERFLGVALDPGGSLTIDGRIRAGASAGTVERAISVSSASGLIVETHLSLTVVETYQFDRRSVDFGAVELGGDYRQIINVKGANLLSCSASDTWLQATVLGPDRLDVALLPERLPSGPNLATIEVKLDDPYVSAALLSVRAMSRSSLRAMPSYVFLPDGEARRVRFVDADGEFVRVASATSESTDILAEIQDGDVLVRLAGREPVRNVVVLAEDAEGRIAKVLVTAPP